MDDPRYSSTGQRLPPLICPTCGECLDAATPAEGEGQPSTGDVSICVYCGEVYEFSSTMELQPATLASLMDMNPKQRALIGEAQRLIRGGNASNR